jgi:hypothetical protein
VCLGTVRVNPHNNPHSTKIQAESRNLYSRYGGVWESNPPTGGLTRSTGFEVQGPHQQPNASRAVILITYRLGVKVNLVDGA